MKEKLFCCILIGVLTAQMIGCGRVTQERVENSDTVETEETDPAEKDLFISLTDMPWRDNSLDVYSALLNLPLRYTEQEGALEGGICEYILGSGQAAVFKKHISQEKAENWDEIKVVTEQGEENSFRLAFQEGKINQAWAVGGIAGSDHYMMLDIENADDQSLLYRFFETDGTMRVLNSFYVDCLDKREYEFPQQLQVDSQGNLHMITSRITENTLHYYIVASDGTFLMEAGPEKGFSGEQEPELILLFDGRVAVKFGKELQCMDITTGETETLANVKSDYRGCTLWNEKMLLYADDTGLYRSGLSGENPELLYMWSNHGIALSEIKAMQVAENGDISLIYMSQGGANYLRLTRTTEEVEIQEITFAVFPGSEKKYQFMVSEFNKKYPAYRVKMQTCGFNDNNRLLTELIAGEGPVLLEASLVGFEDNDKWWEPLDEILLQMDLEGELIPQVIAAGKINGTQYGIVTDFSIRTVVTFAKKPEEWDYDTFLDCFDEEDPSLKSVFNAVNGSDGFVFMNSFFLHSLKEKYLFDAQSGTTFFDSEKFRKILRLSRSFMKTERQGNAEELMKGTSPCAVVQIQKPEDLACLRIWGEGELRYIGYPSGTGSVHYILADPIVVRANASAEEKRLAHSFLQFLLSYDVQAAAALDSSNFSRRMSARGDVLDDQISSMNEFSYTDLNGFPQLHLKDQLDNETDRAVMYELLEKAEPKENIPREFLNIFTDELTEYLSGNMTEDTLIEHLENRVGLYLSEQR